ncbi:MAG TPA: protoglobin domain-containing protein [Nitrospirota bacterium]|nr:protoglobin domain-containing protein [Nitrospirota bacterium]
MRSFKEIIHDYRFTSDDEKRLAGLRPLIEENAQEIMSTVNLWIMGTAGAAKFFTEETRERHVFEMQKNWLLALFSGEYKNKYYETLVRIGSSHVKRNVDVHYMSRVANIVKNSCVGLIKKNVDDRDELIDKIVSVGKIIDISLDVITMAYIEEELRTYSPVYKVRSAMIGFSERFTQSANMILVLALIGLTLGVVWLFLQDVMHVFTGDIERGIISSLGSMLLLWLMIELMSTEIAHLKGGKFHISVFVGVALVTMIRETMIATLRHEKPESIYYLIAAILVIGIVYWIVSKAEEKTP